MRIFVGIVPPPELSARVLRLARELTPPLAIPRSEPHITLNSPQHVDSDEATRAILSDIASSHGRITVQLMALAGFRSKYLAVKVQSGSLRSLRKEIVNRLLEFNTPGIQYFPDESYDPHLTIAKDDSLKLDAELYLSQINQNFPLPESFIADRLILFCLDEKTGEYARAAEFALSG